MLDGIINEQGKCLDETDVISEGNHIVSYKSLVFGAYILEIIFIADNKPMDLCYRCYK